MTNTDENTTAVAKLAMVTLDAREVRPMTHFWSQVLGWSVAFEDENYAMLTGPSCALGIGRADDYQPPAWPDSGHKQFHLDLTSDDVQGAAARCVELGATRPAEQPGETWVVLLDPAGHPFCISDAKNWS